MSKSKTLTYGVLLGSICMIGAGIYRNEVNIVLKKAVNLCLECIGIG
ncbi:CD1871A family CXXC motif-containing protein [Inediibacterium massiliense]|nr:CD1871A family CXXC motif-containing protein [Inediibacterium massiliense]